MTDLNEFLEHYGVRGMHWGIRKYSGSTHNTDYKVGDKTYKDVPVYPHGVLPKGKLHTHIQILGPLDKNGTGEAELRVPKDNPNHSLLNKKIKTSKEISADAHKFHELKKKAKTKGLASLNNEEVKALNARFNLEQTYHKAFPKQHGLIVSLFINGVLAKTGKKTLKEAATDPVALAVIAKALSKSTKLIKPVGKHVLP